MKTDLPKFRPARRLFARAARLSQRWSSYVALMVRRHGDIVGNHTSGCYNPDWPEHVKNRLRWLSQGSSEICASGFAARPPRVHQSTMRALASREYRRSGKPYYYGIH